MASAERDIKLNEQEVIVIDKLSSSTKAKGARSVATMFVNWILVAENTPDSELEVREGGVLYYKTPPLFIDLIPETEDISNMTLEPGVA